VNNLNLSVGFDACLSSSHCLSLSFASTSAVATPLRLSLPHKACLGDGRQELKEGGGIHVYEHPVGHVAVRVVESVGQPREETRQNQPKNQHQRSESHPLALVVAWIGGIEPEHAGLEGAKEACKDRSACEKAKGAGEPHIREELHGGEKHSHACTVGHCWHPDRTPLLLSVYSA